MHARVVTTVAHTLSGPLYIRTCYDNLDNVHNYYPDEVRLISFDLNLSEVNQEIDRVRVYIHVK